MNAYCFHCGLPVPNDADFPIHYRHTHYPACCIGCQAVAHTIIDGGLGDYYLHRTQDATQVTPLPTTLLEQLKLYDSDKLQRSFVHVEENNIREATLIIEGITCAACIWLNEHHLQRLPGIVSVNIHYSNHRARIRWDNTQLTLSHILEAIHAIGYRAFPYDTTRQERLNQQERKQMLNRLWIAGLSMMQVMMYAIPVYLADATDMETRFLWILHWASFFLTLPVVLYSAIPFYQGTWRDFKRHRVGMDTPITMGILTTFCASSWALMNHVEHGIYFDSVSMFIFLLLGGRYLESLARRKAGEATENLVKLIPAFAHHLPNWPNNEISRELPVSEVIPGHTLLIKPGETVPADGYILKGQSTANEALLTGEGLPIPKASGNTLIAGSTNLDSPLIMRVTQTGQTTRLASIVRLLDQALALKPFQHRLADRFAHYFATFLLIIALGCYVVWYPLAPEQALWITVSVLVISCPCALSLATPTALTAASGHLAQIGVLITRSHALEALAHVTDVVFDKTGTLTKGQLTLSHIIPFSTRESDFLLAIAGALEHGSEHPIARSFISLTSSLSHPLHVNERINYPGKGIAGDIDDVYWHLGTLEFVAELAGPLPPPLIEAPAAATVVGLGSSRGWEAILIFSDQTKPEANDTILRLKAAGLVTHIVSGDSEHTVAHLANQLKVDHHCARATPEGKLAYVTTLQERNAQVLMVGDGINDAPVLARANISMAMGSGTDITQASSDMIIMNNELGCLPYAISIARKTFTIIQQNLWWATAYNIIALPLAMGGFVTPWAASLGMASSSLLVVINALRLIKRK